MSRNFWHAGWLMITLQSIPALAQDLSAWLPQTEQVAQVIKNSPRIGAARAQHEAQLEQARGTEAGPADWTLRLNQQQRRTQEVPSRFGETGVSMERPVRLWGKAGLDAELAERERELARIGLADALHESSRQLLQLWWDAQRARSDWEAAQRDEQLAAELRRQAQVRLNQGDVAALDARLAEADLQRAQAATHLAFAEWSRRRNQLQRLYPGLPEPVGASRRDGPIGPIGPLGLPGQAMADALKDYLAHHHELNLLRAEVRRQQQWAERMVRDRRPDPTVGIYVSRERSGAEQVLGLSLSMPLSGTWRDAQARTALAQAQMKEDTLRQLERELTADFEGRWHQLVDGQKALQALRAAASTQALAAEKSGTAYRLGEHSMTEVIQNRRLAHEQALAADRLYLDGLRQWALLELDAHRLWDLDD